MTLYFYWTRIYRLIIIALLVTGMYAQAQCVEKTEAAGAIGDTVHFYYCETPGGDQIGVGSGSSLFFLYNNTWEQGWFWEELSDGTYYYFHIIRDITQQADFVTTVMLLPIEGEIIARSLEMTVYGEAAPQLCKDENGDPLNVLPYIVTADFGNSVISAMCILNLDESGRFDVSSPVGVTDKIDPGSNSSFTVSVNDQPETGSYFEQEIGLKVTGMSVADVGNWTVDVTNGVGTFTVNVTIQATGPPQNCSAIDAYIVASLGSSNQSTVCVVSQSGLSFSWERTAPACQVDTNGSPTFSVTADQGQDNPVMYELVFEVDNMTYADIGWWTVTVYNSDGCSQWEVSVEDNGPSLCNTDTPIMEGELYTDTTTSVYIFSYDNLEPSNVNIEQSSSNTSQSTIDVDVLPKDATMLTQQLVLTKYNLTEADFGEWTVNVTNTFGSLQFDVIFRESSGAVTAREDKSSSVNWLAVGLGLASLLIIIVIVVAVVFIVRRNKGLSKRRQEVGRSISNIYTVHAAGRDTASPYQNIHPNSAEPTQQPSGTPNYEIINDADVESTQDRSGPVMATTGGEYVLPDSGEARSDHAEATPGEYVTMDSELPASNRSDHNVPTTSRYETVSADFPFTRATRTIFGGTSDRGQPGMTSGPYDLCNSADIEPPNVYQRMDDGSYVNHAIGRESGGARETYNNVASAYENAA